MTIPIQQQNIVYFSTILLSTLKLIKIQISAKSTLLFNYIKTLTAPLLIKFMVHNNNNVKALSEYFNGDDDFDQNNNFEQNNHFNQNISEKLSIWLNSNSFSDFCFPMLLTMTTTLKQLSPDTPLNTLLTQELKERLSHIVAKK